eukprot:5205283-Amphidinium_carterae.1
MPPAAGDEQDVPKELCCAATLKPLCMPVVTLEGVAYSYVALYAIFMKAQGQPKCRQTGSPLRFFPAPCIGLQHYMQTYHPKVSKSRFKEDEAQLMAQFGLKMPDIGAAPATSEDASWEEEFECKATGELVYKPCVLSSGTIVSKAAVPDGGFKKDPDRLLACALYGQSPMVAPALEFVMRKLFSEEYADAARKAPAVLDSTAPLHNAAWDPSEHVHF